LLSIVLPQFIADGLECPMKKMLLSIAVLTLLHPHGLACDKCGRPHHQFAPASPPFVVTPSAVSSVQMAYAVPAVTYSPTMTVASAPVMLSTATPQSLQLVQAQPSLASAAPLYYTVSPATQSAFATHSLVAPASVYYATNELVATPSSAPTHSLIGDLLIGIGGEIAKPAACEICKSLNCSTGGGNSSTDSIKSLKDAIAEIGGLIKAVKGLEKEIKDAADGNVSIEEPAAVHETEVAKLTQLRDEVRAMNQVRKSPRVAEGIR